MKLTKTIFALGAAASVFGLSACGTTMRTITAETWDTRKGEDGILYMSYWQGKASLFSGKGDMLVQACHIAEDNSLACKNQEEAQDALNVRGRGKGETK